MRTAAMLGFEAARHRWESAREMGADSVRAYPPLVEVLWWASAIDEQLWADADYEQRRDADQSGRVLPGVRFARNRANHFLAAVQTDDPAFTLDLSRLDEARLDLVELKWARAEDLPTGRVDENGQRAYERFMAGRPVLDTVKEVRSWLHRSGIFPPS